MLLGRGGSWCWWRGAGSSEENNKHSGLIRGKASDNKSENFSSPTISELDKQKLKYLIFYPGWFSPLLLPNGFTWVDW